jgi:hypothetical protein
MTVTLNKLKKDFTVTPPQGGVWPRMRIMRLYKQRLRRMPDAALRRHGD